jgi:hypothetical protein
MADTKISALPADTYLDGSEEFPLEVGGTTYKVTAAQIAAGQFCRLNADYTLTSQTAAQKLFNASTNGALTLPVGTYELEAVITITGMSATSGNGAFGLLGAGTAVLANQEISAVGLDATTQVTGVANGGGVLNQVSAFTTNTVTAATGTAMGFTLKGMFDVTTAGTIIPSIALVTAAAAVVKKGSFFKVRKIAAAAVVTLGNWS